MSGTETVVQELQAAVTAALTSLKPFVDEASDFDWRPSDGFLPFVTRAIVRRQYDALSAIVALVAQERGYAAVPLLRPACEEVLWMKYLKSITHDQAEELLVCQSNLESLKLLQAQDAYGGREATAQLGLLPHLQLSELRELDVREKLRSVGRELGWPQKCLKEGEGPSSWFLAQKTGQERLYRFLYFGTSRFVHFNVVELLRRGWTFQPGKVSIRSDHLGSYWAAFALHWGFHLFNEMLRLVMDTPGLPQAEQVHIHEYLQAGRRIGLLGQIPIVTAEELDWPA